MNNGKKSLLPIEPKHIREPVMYQTFQTESMWASKSGIKYNCPNEGTLIMDKRPRDDEPHDEEHFCAKQAKTISSSGNKPLSTTNPTQLQSAVTQLNQVNYEGSQHVSSALDASDQFGNIGESSSIVVELGNKIEAKWSDKPSHRLALLVHKDSYNQGATWHYLQVVKTSVASRRTSDDYHNSNTVATIQPPHAAKARAGTTRLDASWDNDIKISLKKTVYRIYQTFVLSSKSFPNKTVANAQAIVDNLMIEKRLAQKESPTWLAQRVQAMKKRGIDLLDELNNEFVEAIKEESQSKLDGPLTSERKDKGKSKESTSQAEQPSNVAMEDIRTISRTLASVINEKLDYRTLATRLQDLQRVYSNAIHGLSHCISVLLNMILQGNFNADGTLFDCNLLDLHGYGLFSKAPAIVKPDIDDSVTITELNLQRVHGFKKVALGSLQILPICGRISNRAKKEKPKAKKRSNTKRLMDNFFWALVKENSKRDIIQHWSDKLFSAEAYTDDSVISGAVVNTGYNTGIDPKAKPNSNIDAGTDTCSKDEQDIQDEAEDQEEDEDENCKQEADLTSREIKALVPVCIMLCESGEIEGDISYAYLKKQLYSDKQESIPTESLEVCARLDHNLLKLDGQSVFSSAASIVSDDDKTAIFNNFFRSRYLAKLFSEQKLSLKYSFTFKSQYDFQFLGSRASKKKGQDNSCIKTSLGQATEDDKESAKSLTAALKALKADLRVRRKELNCLEKQRQDAGRESRRFEKVNKDLDAALYQKFKDI
ncbi:hypothetical protein [Parasitella parasitica]|uniref:Uncharacterized protein n=1 Tax=Parasitella parasitica TaxID=35722 RepID=A0A0B7N6S3_9FUNG|nr:hypothetical protein [Parasitella parasitica]